MGILPKLAALMVVVTLSSSSVVHSPVSTDGVFELLILHNNDMHARFEQTSQLSGTCTTADRELGKCYGGFPRVAHVVKEARKAAASGEGPPVLYLNAGDTYTGTAWFTIYKWKIAAEFLNALQPDAVSLGNSDLNRDADGLSPLLNNIETPVLAANIMLNNKKSNNNLHKSVIFDVKGTKVGLVGYLTPIADALDSAGDIEYINEVIALREEVENLKTQNVNIIIALGQSNTDTDIEIAREVDGIDLVISGHKNSYYWSGQNKEIESPNQIIVVQKSGKQVPVLQSTPYDKYLGKLMVKFDNNGEIIDCNNAPVLMDESVPQDLQAIEVVTKNKEELAKSATEELGKTAVVLDGDSCKTEECNFGNLVTDAIMYSYAIKYEGDNWTDAPIAVVHSGAISGSIAPNNRPASITRSDLIKALPVEGNIVAVTMNGAVLKQVLEQSVVDLSFERPNGQLLQFSGIRATYDISKEPGSRLVNAVARCSCIVPDFYVIEESRDYKILMPAALADGEFGYTMLKSLPKQEVGTDEVTSVSEYLRLRSPVYPEVASRIVFDGRDNFSEPDSAMHVTSSCLGNHEFDEGVSGLLPFIRNLTSPVLAANLKLEDEPKLMNETNLYKSVVLETGGTRIGVIGYLTPDTAFLSPRNKVKYEDEIVALKREVSDLKKQGIEIIIALGHSGFTKDKEIAEHVDGLDLVIGGHTNTFLWNSDTTNEIPEKVDGRYPVVVIQPNSRKVLVVQAYAYTKYLGRLHLTFDSKGEITKYDGEPILLNQEIPEDPNLLNIVERNREAVGVIYNEVVGKSLVLLNGECRLYECNIGNLITDAMLNYTKQLHPEYDSVNIAICQGGRIRTSIDYPTKPFNVTKGSLLDVLPFSDNLSIVKMNGTMLKQALEHSVAMWSTVDKKGQFLQMSGIEVTFDLAKPPGSRVVDMRAICSKCENAMSKVKDYYEYNIIMPFFLAQGGDNFTMFVNLPKETTRYNEFDCVVEYTRNYSPINANVTGRITIVNSESVNNLQLLATNNSASENIHRALNTLYLIALIFFKYL